MTDEPQDWRSSAEMRKAGLCPKCGSEMIQKWRRSGGRRLVYCPKCGLDAAWVFGHEEKVPLVDPWNPYMADDDGEKR